MYSLAASVDVVGAGGVYAAAIGIADVLKPEYGGWATIPEGDVPVYWACGITPQVAIEHAKPSFCITHKAGHMLITDRLNAEFATL